MATTLCDLIPRDQNLASDVLLGRILENAESRAASREGRIPNVEWRTAATAGREPAILELFNEKSVILNTPLGRAAAFA